MTTVLDDADELFAALAEPTRRDLLERLAARGSATATALARDVPVTRQAVARHLAVLENAALVSSSKAGRERHFVVRTERLATAAGWMSQVAAQWEARLATLKALAETPSG